MVMELIGRIVLIAALLAAPWPFGSVTPAPQWWLCLTIAGLVVWRLVESLLHRPDRPAHIPAAAVAPVGLLVLATIQLAPREEPFVPKMEHAVFADWADAFASDTPTGGTVAPAVTRTQISRLFFALAAFLLGAQWFATPASQLWLCRGLAINGLLLAFFGIVQKITWTGQLFWSVPLRYGGVPFASFVNRNNAAGYLNLCLAAGVGWYLLKYGTQFVSPQQRHPQRRLKLPWKVRLLRAIAALDGPQLALLGLVTLIVAAILFSLSRGGVVAMGIGLLVALVYQRGLPRSGIILTLSLLGAAAIGILLWVGSWDLVADRLASLSTPGDAAEGRILHWWDTSHAVLDFPMLGTGLGTYRYANLPYQVHFGNAWYVNADNHYLEMLVETGILGLGLYLCGFVLVALAAVFLAKQNRLELRAIGSLGLLVITTQAVQAVTDFGLLIPANAVTFAVLCGAVCGTACAEADFQRLRPPLWLSLARFDGRWSHSLLNLLLTLVSAAFGLQMFAATQTALARNVEVVIDRRDPLGTREEVLEAAIQRATSALKYQPDDPELHRAIALWWIDRYRLLAARELSESDDTANNLRGRQLWQLTSVGVLNARVNALTQQGQHRQVDNIRELPLVRDQLLPARQHLLQAAMHGPLTRDVSKSLAHLSFVENSPDWQDEMATHLKRALWIAPSSPDALFEAGVLAKAAGQIDLSDRAFARCLAVSEDRLEEIWALASEDRPVEEVLENAIPDRLHVLVALAEHVPDKMVKSTLARRAERVLNEGNWGADEEASHLLQARLAELLGQPDRAIDQYRSAIAEDPEAIETRLRMAQLLLREGRLEEAQDAFSMLHRLAPNRNDIKKQLEKLILRNLDVPKSEWD